VWFLYTKPSTINRSYVQNIYSCCKSCHEEYSHPPPLSSFNHASLCIQQIPSLWGSSNRYWYPVYQQELLKQAFGIYRFVSAFKQGFLSAGVLSHADSYANGSIRASYYLYVWLGRRKDVLYEHKKLGRIYIWNASLDPILEDEKVGLERLISKRLIEKS
jgi:hypothetical protein